MEGWDTVLADAEAMLAELEQHVKELKLAIRICKAKIAAGVPFPILTRKED